jgi:hypothetical protein
LLGLRNGWHSRNLEIGCYRGLMIKPNEPVLGRLYAIRHDTELTGWLSASLEAYRDAAVMQRDETELRIIQGKAQVLKEILELIAKSPETIDKLRRA